MEKVTVPLAGGHAYDIWTGPAAGLREKLGPLLSGRRFMTVADSNTVRMADAMGLADPVVIPAG